MSSVTVTRHIDAPASKLWAKVGDPGALGAWHPAIADCTIQRIDGKLIRTSTLEDGAVIEERIEDQDPVHRWYRYTMTDTPLPLHDYESVLSVHGDEEGATVMWRGRFEADAEPAEVEQLVQGFYEAGLDALSEDFNGG